QVPATGHHFRDARPAHEGCVVSVPPADLLDGVAKKDHGVRCRDSLYRHHGEFELAGPVFDLERTKRKIELSEVLAQDFRDWLDLVEAHLGEVLVTLRQDLDLGRPAWLTRILGLQPGIYQLEHME